MAGAGTLTSPIIRTLRPSKVKCLLEIWGPWSLTSPIIRTLRPNKSKFSNGLVED